MRLANILLCKVIQMSLPSLSPVMPLSLSPSLFCGDCLSVWKFVSAAAPGWGLFWEVDKEEWDGWHTSRDTHHHAPCTTKSPTHACTHTHTCLMRGRIIKVQFISQLLKWIQFTVFKFWKNVCCIKMSFICHARKYILLILRSVFILYVLFLCCFISPVCKHQSAIGVLKRYFRPSKHVHGYFLKQSFVYGFSLPYTCKQRFR